LAILVSDTSVLIDLERGSLLEPLFSLSHGFVVPDLLYRRELASSIGPDLVSRGLIVESLTPDEVRRATVVTRARSSLSAPDAFAFALAESRSWTLLTGDGGLRAAATQAGITHHGVLWVLDELEREAVVDKPGLHAGLTAISTHPRCRLPGAEVQARLARFKT
jgi:predicted nucleic acid-binding protein